MGQKVCSKDGKRYSGENKRKTVEIITKLYSSGLRTPGRNGRPIGGDEMRTNGRLGQLVRQHTLLRSRINQKIAVGTAVVKMEQLAGGGKAVYKPPAARAISPAKRKERGRGGLQRQICGENGRTACWGAGKLVGQVYDPERSGGWRLGRRSGGGRRGEGQLR